MIGTTTGAVSRSTQAYCLQVARANVLDWGEAYTSTRYPDLHEANQLRDFAVSDDTDIPLAWATIEAHFSQRGLRCFRWTAATNGPGAALDSFMCGKGYRRRELLACALGDWPAPIEQTAIRVLPARAMREQYRQTFLDSGSLYPRASREMWAEANLERFDDSRYEPHVALLDGQAVGRCGLIEVGDIGRIVDIYVSPEYRRRGLGATMLAAMVSLARQGSARTVCLTVESDSLPARRCVGRAGFVEDGVLVEYNHPEVVLPERAQP